MRQSRKLWGRMIILEGNRKLKLAQSVCRRISLCQNVFAVV
jgi:hypothetical protein